MWRAHSCAPRSQSCERVFRQNKTRPHEWGRLEFLHFWRRWVGQRGADTRVCRAETRLGAPPPFPGARPAIVLRPLDQPSLHGVVLDVRRDSFPFLFISDSMIVRLCRPKRFARTSQDTIRLPCRTARLRRSAPLRDCISFDGEILGNSSTWTWLDMTTEAPSS